MVDVDGHVIAINIARSERVSTYMIPGKVVQALLSNLATGKFTLAKDADTLSGELREYEIAIRKAQEAMKAAEAGRAAAEEALSKAVVDDKPYGIKAYVNDGSGEVQIFVNLDTNDEPLIDTTKLAVGTAVEITGFSEQYDKDYEIAPRKSSDLVVTPP